MDARVKPAHGGKRKTNAAMLNKVVEISAIHPFYLKVRFRDGASGVHDRSALVNG
jgi:hypothetical protein